MYTIPELRLNLYQDVRIPSAKDLYEKLGMRSVASAGSVGKDGDFTEPVNVSADKITDLAIGQYELYKQYDAEMAAKSNSDASSVENDDAAE